MKTLYYSDTKDYIIIGRKVELAILAKEMKEETILKFSNTLKSWVLYVKGGVA
jgi:hypothetical protein